MFPAFPTGKTWISGACPNKSMTSKAAVFCPSIRNGLKDVQWILNSGGKPTVIPVDMKKAAKVIGLK